MFLIRFDTLEGHRGLLKFAQVPILKPATSPLLLHHHIQNGKDVSHLPEILLPKSCPFSPEK